MTAETTSGVTDFAADERTSGGDEEDGTRGDIYSSGGRQQQHFVSRQVNELPTTGEERANSLSRIQ
jgi:hypothetical protein